jgi:hypothetical protein
MKHSARTAKFMVCLTIAVGLAGCKYFSSEGSQAAAEAHLQQEMSLWMAGQESATSRADFSNAGLKPPIGYNVTSIVPVQADLFAQTVEKPLPPDWKTWPAYQFNIVLQWASEAGTPLTTVVRYNLTWNPIEQKWFVANVL